MLARRALSPGSAGKCSSCGRRSPRTKARPSPICLASDGCERALYAGDDTTDLDAFQALAGLELGVAVAVASAEGPPELREAADVVVGSPAELLELLREL